MGKTRALRKYRRKSKRVKMHIKPFSKKSRKRATKHKKNKRRNITVKSRKNNKRSNYSGGGGWMFSRRSTPEISIKDKLKEFYIEAFKYENFINLFYLNKASYWKDPNDGDVFKTRYIVLYKSHIEVYSSLDNALKNIKLDYGRTVRDAFYFTYLKVSDLEYDPFHDNKSISLTFTKSKMHIPPGASVSFTVYPVSDSEISKTKFKFLSDYLKFNYFNDLATREEIKDPLEGEYYRKLRDNAMAAAKGKEGAREAVAVAAVAEAVADEAAEMEMRQPPPPVAVAAVAAEEEEEEEEAEMRPAVAAEAATTTKHHSDLVSTTV